MSDPVKVICVDLYPNGEKYLAFEKEFDIPAMAEVFLEWWREIGEHYNGYDFAFAHKVIYYDGFTKQSLLWRDGYENLPKKEMGNGQTCL